MPLLTLSTDIGQQDFVVGAIKGQLVSSISQLSLVDVTHYLPQDNFAHAAYICKNAFSYYPPQTIHVVLINVYEAETGSFVLAQYNNQYIVCPNNGFITMLVGSVPDNTVVLPMLNTGNILDITQQLITAIQQITQKQPLEKIGTKGLTIVDKAMLKPTIGEDWIEGQILFIDNFDNAVINITKEAFEKERNNRNFKIIFKRDEVISNISNNYSSVPESEILAWFNAAGYLELAINKGKMSSLFGLNSFKEEMFKNGTAVQNQWFYQTVRIFFE